MDNSEKIIFGDLVKSLALDVLLVLKKGLSNLPCNLFERNTEGYKGPCKSALFHGRRLFLRGNHIQNPMQL